jgi:DNA-binding CsgD family transcriptional regulator
VAAICRDALSGPPVADGVADQLEAELFAADVINGATSARARARWRSRLSDPDAPDTWRIHEALMATGGSGGDALTRLAPVLATGLRGIPADSIIAVHALLALIWDDELGTASGICDTVLAAARRRGSMSMVAHASCLRSMIMRRLGRLEEAAAGARPRRAALTGPDALTASERRVASLAAEGLSNRQIAEHLFITQATVETHLRHAFRKLGVTSRAGLGLGLGDHSR